MYIKYLLIINILAIVSLFIIPRENIKGLSFMSLLWSLIMLIYNNIYLMYFHKSNIFQDYLDIYWLNKSLSLNWGDVLLTVDGLSVFFY